MQYLKNYPIFGEARGGEDEHQGLKGHVSAAQEAIAIVGGGGQGENTEKTCTLSTQKICIFFTKAFARCAKKECFLLSQNIK